MNDGNLAAAYKEDNELCDYRQIDGDWNKEQILNCLPRLRRNFLAEWDRELFWFSETKAKGPDCWLYVEDDGCRLEVNMYYWIKGFLANAYPVKATFVPGPEADKDVHTEHCCHEHGCKYGAEDCSVENGTKQQSFPCPSCDGSDDW